jgi:hypothetical protein
VELPPVGTSKTVEREPLVRVNGWSIKISAIVQILAIVGGGFAAWYSLSSKVEMSLERLKDVSSRVEANRVERLEATEALRADTQRARETDARFGEQILNLQLLMGDVKRQIEGLDLSGERRVDPTRIRDRDNPNEAK